MTSLSVNSIISTVESLLGGSSSNISPTSFLSLFGSNNLTANVLTQYIDGYTNTIPISTVDQTPNLSSTVSDISIDTIAYDANIVTRNNVTGSNTTANGVVNPTTRYVAPIANEPPVPTQTSYYPYNKAFLSEGGHLQEVDDTPGNERLLNQHVSGTYDEMKGSGDRVLKVVGDNYTIVAGANYVTIQGAIQIHGEQECNLRVSGAINIIADGGINIATKGDLRFRASSIYFESTSGDISMLSAANTTVTATSDINLKGKDIFSQADKVISSTSGLGSVIAGNKVSIVSNSDIVANSVSTISLQSGTDTNIISGGKHAVTSSSTEINSTLNVKNQTNLLASGQPVTGQGAASAASESADATTIAALSTGSGITGSNNPDDIFMLTDDDDQASMSAIKAGLQNGTIKAADLIPPASAQDDTSPAGNVVISTSASPITALPTSGAIDNLQLSPRFTLGMLSKYALVSPTPVTAQHGLSQLQIVQNLQLNALNCLEPIKAKFSDMQVTSGFRIGSSSSQHELGMAIDMQFASANANRTLYYTYAQWIRDNVPFDQLILEFKNTGTKLPWIHVSFNGKSNRGQILTKFAGGGYGNGLHDLSA